MEVTKVIKHFSVGGFNPGRNSGDYHEDRKQKRKFLIVQKKNGTNENTNTCYLRT